LVVEGRPSPTGVFLTCSKGLAYDDPDEPRGGPDAAVTYTAPRDRAPAANRNRRE